MKPHHLPTPAVQPQHPSLSQPQLCQAAANQDLRKWEFLWGKERFAEMGYLGLV